MSEAVMKTEATKMKAGRTAAAFESVQDAPKSELPRFDLPTTLAPAVFREWAEKGVSQAKDNYEKMKAAAEETTELLEDSFANAARGSTAYGLKVLEVVRANSNATFDLARDLMSVTSLSEMIELSTAHARKQFDAMSAQTKELTALAQKVATDATEPMKAGVTKAFNKAS